MTRRIQQPPDRWFQAFWTALHVQAAVLAQIAVFMHLGSAYYHLARMSEDEDTPPLRIIPAGEMAVREAERIIGGER